jgi:GNAT superfamily N-acetyltransferase
MKTIDAHFKISIAKSSDYEKIVRLCKRSDGPRGYVLPILHEVIDDGGFFLAWQHGELIGVTNFDKCIDGSGWLSMARTDPSWRGKGVAGFLQQEIATHARRRGIRTLRLWVSSRNKPSIKACLKGGFKPVCEAVHLSRNLSVTRKHRRVPALNSIPKDSLKSILKSTYLAKMKGYMAYQWHFVRLDGRVLMQLIHQGEVSSIEDSMFILTKPEKADHGLKNTFTLLDGRVSDAIQAVLQSARQAGVGYVSGYVPYRRYELAVARKAGFRTDPWGKHCIVFEKRVP